MIPLSESMNCVSDNLSSQIDCSIQHYFLKYYNVPNRDEFTKLSLITSTMGQGVRHP